MFIARVSRGRTIREFIVGTVVAPSLAAFVWFSVFGGTALHMEIWQHVPLSEAVKADVATALWGVLVAGIAVSLLLAGGLEAAQTATILLALPFAIVIVLMVVALWRALREDWNAENKREREMRKRVREMLSK